MSNGIISKQPYYIPGYTGHCPEMKNRYGSSFSSLSHDILLNPLIRHSHKLVLADTEAVDYELNQQGCRAPPAKYKVGEMNGEKPFEPEFEEKFAFPIAPGYSGHLPGTDNVISVSRTEKAKETIGLIRDIAQRDAENRKNLQRLTDIQYGRRKAKNLEESLELQNEFALPLIEVRPETMGVVRNVFKDESFRPPPTHNLPYFMEVNDKDKYFVSGYSGHVPFGFAKFGQTFVKGSRSGLKEFTTNYNRRKSTEWAPAGLVREEPAEIWMPHKIYSEKHGIIPKYCGYVPGLQFQSGRTFGDASRDAKRFLRGDFN